MILTVTKAIFTHEHDGLGEHEHEWPVLSLVEGQHAHKMVFASKVLCGPRLEFDDTFALASDFDG